MSSTGSVLQFLKGLLNLLFLKMAPTKTRYLVWFFVIQFTYANAKTTYLILSEIRDITGLVEALTPTIVFILSSVKLSVLAVNRDGLEKLFFDISINLIRGASESQVKRLETACFLSYALSRGLLGGIILFELLYAASNIFLGRYDFSLPIPVLQHLVPGEGRLNLLANALFQLVLMYSAALATVAADSILVLSLLHLDAGLDVLADKIKSLDQRFVTYELREIWKYQLKLYGFKKNIQQVFRIHISVQFLTSMGVLCVSIYGLTGDTLLPMAILVALALGEIFSICYIGQRIERKSDALTGQLYFLPWTQFRRADARRVTVMMIASQQPLTVTTPFVSLTLDTFSQVLKTTYSLYTLLHKAD